MLLLNRAFFSMQRAWVPTYVAIANLTVNATLDWVLSSSLGVWSIPLATSIANIFGVALLYLELRPVAGRLDERELLRAFVRIAVATALAVGVAYGVWRVLDSLLGPVRALPVPHARRRPGRHRRRLHAGREGHGDRGAARRASPCCAAAGGR